MKQLVILWNLAGSARYQVLGGALLRLVQSLLLGVAFGAAMSLVVMIIHRQAVMSSDVLRITMLCSVSIGGQLIAGWAAARLSWLAAYQAVANMRLELLEHLRVIPVNALDKRSRGDLAALLSTDLQLIEDFLSQGLPRLGQALGIPLIVLVAVMINDPLLAVMIALPIIVVVPVMHWSSKKLAQLGDQRQEAQASAAARMIDLVTAMPALRVYSTKEHTLAWYREAVKAFQAISVKMVHRLIVPSNSAGLVLMLGIPLVVLGSGYSFLSRGTDITLIAVVLVVVLNVYHPVQGLLSTNESWQMAQAALRRILVVQHISPLTEPSSPQPLVDPVAGVDIKLRDVFYNYPDGRRGLNGVNLEAKAGETTAIVGESGAGKSTILNLIARFDDPTKGTITVGGVELRNLAAADRSNLITVVFQDILLFPGTVADNIAVGRPEATFEEIVVAARLACADEFIRELPQGYDTVLGEDGAGLSGGQRQRLSIARAALKDAPVVLLDEATSALDPVNEAEIHRGIKALCAGRTTIVVAHKLATITSADRIFVLDEGRVVESGTHQELLKHGKTYARLWRTLSALSKWSL